MIHIYFESFKRKAEDSFHEAYKTHTHQLIAKLSNDTCFIGRR